MASYITANTVDNMLSTHHQPICVKENNRTVDEIIKSINRNYTITSEDTFNTLIKKKEYCNLKKYVECVMQMSETESVCSNMPLTIFSIVNSYLSINLDYKSNNFSENITQFLEIFNTLPASKIELAVFFYLKNIDPVFLFLTIDEIPYKYMNDDNSFMNYYFVFIIKLLLYGFNNKTIEYGNKLNSYMTSSQYTNKKIKKIHNVVIESSLHSSSFPNDIKESFDNYIFFLDKKKKYKAYSVYNKTIKPFICALINKPTNKHMIDVNKYNRTYIENHNYFNELYHFDNSSISIQDEKTQTCIFNCTQCNNSVSQMYSCYITNDILDAIKDKFVCDRCNNIEEPELDNDENNFTDCDFCGKILSYTNTQDDLSNKDIPTYCVKCSFNYNDNPPDYSDDNTDDYSDVD